MAKFNEQHVFTGMQRDIDVSRHPASFLYDARNIRLTQRDGEGDTLYAITNEKGTELTSISIVGNYLGHALLNQYLVIFSRDNSGVAPPGYDTPIPDWVTMIDLSTLTKRTLYHGDLGFNLDHPISAIGYYENEDIQKVYWVDGENQPRVINLFGVIKPDVNTQFDFLPTLSLNEKIYVTKQTGSTGSFPSGVIQYMFTYYRKFGQESNIFYTTPLLYISPLDRGGAPDEKVSNSFKIEIKDVDTDHNFDYIRIYSLQRTSKDGTPIAKRVKDIEIRSGNSEYTFIDTGAEGESIDPTELLYKQREAVIVNTLEQKDNTIFLGDIQYEHEAPPVLSASDITIESSTRTIKSKQGKRNNTYTYYNQLNVIETETVNNTTMERSISCGGFKRGEYYRLGVQFQDKYGKWSDPMFISDEMETEWPSISNNEESEILLPTFKGSITKDYVKRLVKQGYVKARAVVVFPDIQDREILCQGVSCPTVYRKRDLSTAGEQCQSSWFFRPKHSDNKYLISNSGAIAPMYEGEIPTSAELVTERGISAGTITALPRQWEIQGYYNIKNRFNIASYYPNSSIWFSTFHSPDIEFVSDIISQSFDYTSYKLVGYADIDRTLSDIDIQTSSPTISNMGSGFDHHSFITAGAKGIIAGLFYDDFVVDEMKDSNPPNFRDYDEEKSPVKWLVYPWHRSGSLNNDINRPSNAGTRSAELLKKRISNLRYSKTSWIKWSTLSGDSGPSSNLDDTLPSNDFRESLYPSLFIEDDAPIVKIGSTIYKGNVDTVLMPDLPDGFYFCFNDTITDKHIQAELIRQGNIPAISTWMNWIKTKDGYFHSGDSFTSPAVAMLQTDFTSDSWWKTFAISEDQTSAPTSITGTVEVSTDFGEVYITDLEGNVLGKRYSAPIGAQLRLVVMPQNGYEINVWAMGYRGIIIPQTRGLQEILITVSSSDNVVYYAFLNYVSNTSNMVHIHLFSSPNNAGIVTGEGDYTVGSTVVISAVANSGYSFVNWKGSAQQIVSTESSTSITVPSSGGSYTAYFAPEGKKGVTFTLSPSDGGWLYVNSDNPPSGTTMYYDEGTELNINVVSDSESGYELDYLEIDGNRISGDTTTLTVTTNHTVRAVFEQGESTESTQSWSYSESRGSVSVNGSPVDSNTSTNYPIGTSLVLRATPMSEFDFYGWYIDGSLVQGNPYSFVVSNSSHSISASFIEKQEQLKVYVTSNVVDESRGYANIVIGSSNYVIDSSHPTAEIPYAEGMIMTVSSSNTKTFSKWQYSTDDITYIDVPSSGNSITVSNQESDCYYKAIFN